MPLYLLSIIAYLLVVAVNGLANALPINGQTTGDIANRIEVLFTPAGYVFSIWGLIYALLAVWLVRQFPRERRDLPVYTSVRPLFILSCALNVLWIFCWHYNFFLVSVFVMLGLLVTLILIYLRIKANDPAYLDLLPFSVYLGWISVATVANISYVLVDNEWSGWGWSAQTWTVIMMFVATILAYLFLRTQQDRAYVLVFVWALFGIGVANYGEYEKVSNVAFGLANVLLLTLLANVFVIRNMKRAARESATSQK
jgi:benzodiazapine receptor